MNTPRGWLSENRGETPRLKSFRTTFLPASLLWDSIGAGYFIYGKKQSAMMPMIGGILMIAFLTWSAVGC